MQCSSGAPAIFIVNGMSYSFLEIHARYTPGARSAAIVANQMLSQHMYRKSRRGHNYPRDRTTLLHINNLLVLSENYVCHKLFRS